ncbi:hypothetical protein MetMK1DRAFT_00029700 [Metallosphaera yellowstonensis MK1]|jgi:hypothetical protein|uniref:NurA domain-containing protein n=1 Tax=Metallosphaera yellowstonensis MK1 TaxID=671065 RepID=H2C8Q5_9CREN|nr:DNA double-strand break repair nuclease NurA [Metallosphaera yellowstonensis]EHP68531.1 hypothetical protein MetMK1DRAFT_00029700 [Metallosphaera yellowstonensis MK1]
MSVISDRGVSSTVVRLYPEDNYVFDIRVAAVDGSLHEFITEDGNYSYVNVSAVIFRLTSSLIYQGGHVKEFIVQGPGEEAMRQIEYEEARNLRSEMEDVIILMDRKISMDRELGIEIPRNIIGIVKDFDQRERSILDESGAPWIVLSGNGLRTGFVRFSDGGWVFRIETDLNYEQRQLLALLYRMAREPIPEAINYNYPLFLADKMAKFYRDRARRGLDFLSSKKFLKYRDFRRIVEIGRRRVWNSRV